MKEKWYRRNAFWLVLSLVLALVSAIGASAVQTAGGQITVKEMTWETPSGQSMSALLFKPDTATVENPAPAIVVSHGWFNNKEMQEGNFTELARRGFVVISIDMYGHGDSSPLVAATPELGGTGMYDAVTLLADLPYVDTSRIGITGHSNGARAANFSVALDNEADEQLIASVLLVDNDPIYRDADGEYANVYGARDVGVVAAQYDEFFFRTRDANGVVLTNPRDYITTDNAQSFLNYGTDPSGEDARVPGEFYTDGEDGSIRVLWTPPETHPWGHFSKTTVGSAVEFFEESLGAPNPIAADSQVWQVREAFTALGLIAFGMFLIAFTRALLTTRAFAALRAVDLPAAGPAMNRTALIWFWGGLVVSVLISGLSYLFLSNNATIAGIAFVAMPPLFPQGPPFFIGVWAAINGLAALIIVALYFALFGKRNGQTLRASGIAIGGRRLLHSIGLAAVVVAAAFGLVFVVDYFFTTDFRLWVLAVKAFTPEKLLIALPYLPFFLLYFIANSIAINAFNRFTIKGKEWLNTLVLTIGNVFAVIVLVVLQYTTFAVTGATIPWFFGLHSIWLFPVIVILGFAAVFARKLYRSTGNPYIAGFIMGAVVTIISVTNSLTVA